ncbi:MAG: right-handed parallel beta-helix repeat-containing protein [Planctomycetes bacterium]|nr:right-handed parallel beta-helix repeat-containing protein [Planctomycetota bacterium]
MIIENNVIQKNTATYYGGGVHLRQWSHGTISKNRVDENSSSLGGGLHITYYSSPAVIDNLIVNNLSGSFGGAGIYIYFHSNPLVERNVIMKNQSFSGSGIAIYFLSEPVIRNNLIVKNKRGAGILVRTSSKPHIIFNTIAANSCAIYTGGIDCTFNTEPIIENNIITNNGKGFGILSDNTSTPVISYNNIWNNPAGNYGHSLGDQTGLNGNVSLSPGFINPQNNNYQLTLTSDCMNIGHPGYAGTPPTDLDGNIRKIGPFVDLGCFETFQIWNTTSTEKFLTIQEAINVAQNGDRLVVAIGRYEENLNFLGKNIHLLSTDPTDWGIVEKTIIDGTQTDSVVTFENGESLSCLLSGFTITNGTSQSSFGGGLQIRVFSSPTIRNNIITQNRAKNGAGVSLYHSSTKIYNNRIFNNSGVGYSQGGGMMLIDCLEDPNAVVANNIIVGNRATFGGGIRIQQSNARIFNNVIAYNKATFKGLAFYAEGDLIENSIIWGNFNPEGGGSALYQATAAYSCIDEPVPGQGNIMIDPNFADSGFWDDAGTPTLPDDDFFIYGNYHLPPFSPCIDSGHNQSLPKWVTHDIDGETRIVNSIVDIGADEFFRPSADLNLDGRVNIFDLLIQNNDWLMPGSNMPGDLYKDEFIDMADFAVLQGWWNWRGPWILP